MLYYKDMSPEQQAVFRKAMAAKVPKYRWYHALWYKMFGEITGYIRLMALLAILGWGLLAGPVVYVLAHFLRKYW